MTTSAPHRKSTGPRNLSRELIAGTALALVGAHGRAALSMRSLANELGCEAMSLYNHVDGIEGVLDAIVDLLFGLMLAKAPVSRDPRRQLRAYARSYLDLADAWPNAFPLLATRLLHTPAALAAARAVIAPLLEMGYSKRAALRQSRILVAYLNGAGLALAAWRGRQAGADRTRQAVAGDPGLASLAPSIDETSVRADLDAGLKQLLASICAPATA